MLTTFLKPLNFNHMRYSWIFLVILSFTRVQAQDAKNKLQIFEPKMRVSVFTPIEFGDTALNNYYEAGVGLDLNFTLLRYQKFEFTVGGSYIRRGFNGTDSFLPHSRVSQRLVYFQLGREFQLQSKLAVTPTLSLGQERLSFSRSSSQLAVTDLTNLRAGAYFDYNFAKNYAVFAGLHFAYSQSDDLRGTSSFVSEYKKSFAINFSVGIELD